MEGIYHARVHVRVPAEHPVWVSQAHAHTHHVRIHHAHAVAWS